MVVRTQVTLDAEAHARAKRRAGELGISFAEYVRRAVDRDLGESPQRDVSEIFALFRSECSDVAEHKDRYVGEAFASRRSER